MFNIESKDIFKIKIICPICKNEKILPLPKSPILEAKENLTSFFIAKVLVCKHQFQTLINKDFKVQHYQKIDQNYID